VVRPAAGRTSENQTICPVVAVRESKNPEPLLFRSDEWTAFITAAKLGHTT